jgi:hypothetical protein
MKPLKSQNSMMLRMMLTLLLAGILLPATAQIDVTQLTADTKTFIFDNGKNTVKGYIYEELEAKTTCCGSDRIYLEVKIDPSGYVLSAKTLTGKNDCYKESAIDIVKNVKWNAEGFKGPKSVYFEIKPNVTCEGDKKNEYVALPIFNNQKLDSKGVPVTYAGSDGVPSTGKTEPKTEPAPTQPIASAEKPATEKPATAQPPATGDKPAVTPPPVTSEKPVVTEKPKTQPVVTDTKQIPPVEDETPVAADEDLAAAKLRAEEERMAKSREEEALRARLEEAQRQDELRRQEEVRRREEEERKRTEVAAANKAGASGSNDEDDLAGWGYQVPPGGNSEVNRLEQDRQNREGGLARSEMDQEQRMREEIARLQAQQRDTETEMRRLEEESRRSMMERESKMRDLQRIQEDILRKEEEATRAREDKDIERLNRDRLELEGRKREMENQIQKMMDDMRKMQNDIDRQLVDLQKYENDMAKLENEARTREEEIAFEREKRKLEIESAVPATSDRSMTSITPMPGNFTMPPDSDKMGLMIMQIQLLRQEVQRLQQDMSGMRTGNSFSVPGISSSPSQSTRPATKRPQTADGARSAGADRSWEKIDYSPPGTKVVASAAPAVSASNTNLGQYTSSGDKSPDPSHKDTFKNTEGPQFSVPAYEDGEAGMKLFIKDKLRDGGICGLAQGFAEVTVDKNGNVVAHRILKANSAEVQLLLPAILQEMKFRPESNQLSRNAYIQIKAEIRCEGSPVGPIDLKEVPDYLKTN